VTGPGSEAGPGSKAGGVAPHGAWPSPIPIDWLTVGTIGLAEPRPYRGGLVWLELRPEEGGRMVLVGRAADGTTTDLSPAGMNVRDRVHEYGGAPYLAADDVLVVSDFATGRLHRRGTDGRWSALTPARAWRYADLELDPGRGRILAIREDHEPETLARHGEAVNELVAIDLATAEATVLRTGRDFYAAPRLSADGRRLAWLEWDHPNLPWDGMELLVADLDEAGRPDAATRIAGDASTWVTQPRWDPDGSLWFVAEPGEWARLHRWRDGRIEAMTPDGLECASPDWVVGRANHRPLGDGRSVVVGRAGGQDRLHIAGPAAGDLATVDLPFTELGAIVPDGDGVVALAASPTTGIAIVRIGLADGAVEIVRSSLSVTLDPADVSVGVPITFRSSGGRTAHGVYYAPRNRAWRAPEGERPPLIVTSHGGPTAEAFTGLNLTVQAFTSRGIAILDVDYGGSTGYGRTYRRSLEGEWGIVDVDDCVAGARWLADEDRVDPARTVVRGGSASGYTTLAALAFRDAFAAGISYFGIGDLEAFVRETHKFESRYLERLIGPYPAAKTTYEARSPNRHLEGIHVPVLVLQGAEDRIVPPAEAERIVAGLRARGIPHALLLFPGEDHGFRGAAAIRRSFEAELSFLGQVFGFSPADPIEPVVLEPPRARA